MEKETPQKIPWRSKTIQIVILCTLLAPLGVPLISPALPSIQDRFEVSETQASLLISSYFIVGIFLSPFIGILVDQVGRKRVLISSLFVFSTAGIAIYFLDNFTFILLTRFIQGTSAAGLFITTVTLISDAFDGVQRNAVLGINAAALAVGAAIFPIVGGILVSVSWNTPFLTYMLGYPLAIFALKFLEEPTEDIDNKFDRSYLSKTFKKIGRKEMILPYGSSILTELLLFGVIFTLLPFILTDEFDASPVFIGIMISLTSIASAVSSSQSGRIAKFLSDHQMMGLGIGCYGVAVIGVWSMISLPVVSLSVILFGAGIGFSMPAVDSSISDFVPIRYRGGALSIRNSTTFFGRAAGPLIFSAISLRIGYPALLLAVGILVVVLALILSISCTFQIKNSKICVRRGT